MAKILVVDDEEELCAQIAAWLRSQHHEVETVLNGIEAADRLKLCQYEVVILDWDLPGKSGVVICQELRAKGNKTRVLMLTGKAEIQNKKEGFESGADDYLTKPFDLRELSLRIDALLRRPNNFVGTIIEIGDMSLDTSSHKFTKAGKEIHLEPKEFAFLLFSCAIPMKSSALMLCLIAYGTLNLARPQIRLGHIMNLRKKLASTDENDLIKTVHRVGYCFHRTRDTISPRALTLIVQLSFE